MDAGERESTGVKKCSKCEKTKPREQFNKRKKGARDGLCSCCKSCHREIAARWAKQNAQKKKEIDRRWQRENPDKVSLMQRKIHIKRLYGVTYGDYERLLEHQGRCCACCGKHESEQKHRLAVDHVHDSGKIRGLLCNNCNSGIGKLGDNSDGVRKALEYLLKAEGKV